MIENLKLDKDVSEMQINIWEKLNEVIDVVNGLAVQTMDEEDHHDKLLKAAIKAIATGNREDFQAYLKLRKKYL